MQMSSRRDGKRRDGSVFLGQYPWLRGPIGYIVCYLLYALLFVLSFLGIWMVWRRDVLLVLAVLMPESEWVDFIYLCVVALMGLGLFIFVLVAEHYLRSGVPRGQMPGRFVRLAVPLVLLTVVGLGLQVWMLSLL